jgi:DNA-binding NarL/FixJ family response regulator
MSSASRAPLPWRLMLLYGVALALGTAALQWLDYRYLARTTPGEVYVALVALAFLLLGGWAGWRLSRPQPAHPDGHAAVAAQLGISARELEVLHALALGQTTKEIARTLSISPNTVKTHTARLFEKLPATNRTQATARARELGLLS